MVAVDLLMVVELGVGVGVDLGPDQPLNRPHSGGGQLVWERFLCSQQLHFHKPKGREGTGGQWQKDGEGAPRGDVRDEKHNRSGERGGPP